MKDLFLQQLKQWSTDPYQARYLVAVSGGRDSSALAHLFFETNLSFAIAHCNFHLRGNDSIQDAQFVMQMAKQYGAKLYTIDFDTYGEQKARGISIEMTARELRYEWFQKIAADYDFIVTAHHANDTAETLLLNLVRGAGLKGLTSIPSKNGKIIRPLLSFSACEIENYAIKNNINYRIDVTNFDDIFQRNRIRNQVIPLLETINPQLIHTFKQNIDHFNQSYRFYQHQLQSVINEIIAIKNNELFLNIPQLLSHRDASLILFEIMHPLGFNSDQIRQIFSGLQNQTGKIFYSKTHSAVKNRDILILRKLTKNSADQPIFICHETDFKPLGFFVEHIDYTPDFQFENNPNILYLDESQLFYPFIVRHWHAGDYFYPLGMKGKKKVSDFFVDAKIDILKKDAILLLCQNEAIVWIVGYRSDERFKVKKNVKKIAKISYKSYV